ncbi:NADH dehydrogenase [ubiquinone] 1 alpha subcomplex assembly factor 3 [Anopheles gambiae]|uniref:NADH dehydrogenase [ubiquinone] 1 alpha subcomplex assembly factor 3 n=1 Tax=Anopheles gambiae TaxID=7165 RepID=UPI002AC8D301|nr:NADH dehydrogenase [ubiquinone] 1 alpha subcomplex assembly factor 3 [Anopheles gambiae]
MNVLQGLSRIAHQSLRRNFCSSLVRRSSTYESDGKTSVTILNKEADAGLMINSYSQFGFRLNNDMVVIGPMAIFSRTVLSWNVESHEDINDESLSLFCAIEPKIDVLVVGIGDHTITPTFSKKIIDFMKRYKINVEVLGTEQACSTFNFLNAENRVVAAALIPPMTMRVNEDDLMQKQISISKSFEVSDK